MQDPPHTKDLLAHVSAFLRTEVLPELSGALAFHVRVAANAVDLARREVELAPASDAAELARLMALLNREGDLPTLNAALCEAIKAREIDLTTPGLVEHLRLCMLAKLEVDQPNYSAYRRALQTWGRQETSA